MADETKDKKKGKKTVEVPQETLTQIMEKLSKLEAANADKDVQLAALKEGNAEAQPVGKTPLREKKSFEPAFRVVRPIAAHTERWTRAWSHTR